MKWEYLPVSVLGSTTSETFSHLVPRRIDIWDDKGNPTEWRKVPGEASHSPAVSRLLAKLGDDEWELTGIVSLGAPGSAVFYFKRPKP